LPGLEALLAEADRQLTICNACRYCEGYCAVFPALERRPIVTEGDVAYLANLCHDCRACYQACMYTEPHPFAIDVPTLLSRARVAAYERYAWPRPLARAFRRGPGTVAALTAVGALAYLAVAWAVAGGPGILRAGGSFYRLVPYPAMLVPALAVSALVLLVLVAGVVRFWREAGVRVPASTAAGAWRTALAGVAGLRQMSGGGGGCYYPDAGRPARSRRLLHQLVLFGFLAAFVATCLAAVWQDLLGQPPPYPLTHPAVLFGSAGGLAMVAGATGLLWLKGRSSPLASGQEVTLDYAFLVALDLAAASGLLLLAVRDTAAMGPALLLHLGSLAALYLTAPYGKFVHWTYRTAALLLAAAEERAGG
jgi:citrate/tricarballylate utilization protein